MQFTLVLVGICLVLELLLSVSNARITISYDDIARQIVDNCSYLTSTLPTLMFTDDYKWDLKPINLSLAAIHFSGIDDSEKSMTLLATLNITWNHPCDFQWWQNDSDLSFFYGTYLPTALPYNAGIFRLTDGSTVSRLPLCKYCFEGPMYYGHSIYKSWT